jgi:hypothetical protein
VWDMTVARLLPAPTSIARALDHPVLRELHGRRAIKPIVGGSNETSHIS